LRLLNRDFVEAGARIMPINGDSISGGPKKKETTMAKKLNVEMGVIFDEIQIEEVIAPRL